MTEPRQTQADMLPPTAQTALATMELSRTPKPMTDMALETLQVSGLDVSSDTPDASTEPYRYTPKIKPPAILLVGPVGTGKTHSQATWVEAGKSLRCIFLDPGGEEALIDAIESKGLPMKNVHWTYVAPASTDWDTFKNTAQQITSFGYEELAKLKFGVNKAKYRQFYTLLAQLSNFVCARTGEELGPVDKWDSDCAFTLDSLSGLNQICKDLVVGAKPNPHQGEWGVMMDCEERLLNKLTSDCECFVTCIAHIEKVMNEQAGIPIFSPALLGSKLAPRVPRMFSDVILATKEGDQFAWSTVTRNHDLKNRNLPLSDKIAPSFGQIVKKYEQRVANAGKE